MTDKNIYKKMDSYHIEIDKNAENELQKIIKNIYSSKMSLITYYVLLEKIKKWVDITITENINNPF